MSHGHNGAAVGMTHADLSASRDMAFQIERSERELGRRLNGINDPRLILGGAIVFFGGLLILPFVLDYMQDLSLANGRPIVRSESKGPSSTALALIGGTLGGGSFNLQKKVMDGYKKYRVESNRSQVSDEQAEAGGGGAGSPHSGQAHPEAYLTPEGSRDLVAESAGQTVKQMAQASGLAGTSASRDQAFQTGATTASTKPLPNFSRQAEFGQPSEVPAALLEYGGAAYQGSDVRVFIPGQAGPVQMASYQAQPFESAAAAVYQMPPAAAYPAQMQQQMPQAHPNRLPFNPDTSAVVGRMGMRHHVFSSGSAHLAPGNYPGARARLMVSR